MAVREMKDDDGKPVKVDTETGEILSEEKTLGLLDPTPQTTGRIARAMLAMEGMVKHDRENNSVSSDSYSYASADAVYLHIRDALANEGLFPWQSEIESKIVEGKKGSTYPWLTVTYEIGLAYDENKRPEVVEIITAMALLRNAQALQAVRTFALKYYLKGKLLLGTGEKDTDATNDTPPAPEPRTRTRSEQKPATSSRSTSTRKPKAAWELDGSQVYQVEGKFKNKIESAKALTERLIEDFASVDGGHGAARKSELQVIFHQNIATIKKLPERGRNLILAKAKKLGLKTLEEMRGETGDE